MGAAEKQVLLSTTLGCVADFQNGGAWKEGEYVDSGVPVTRVTNCQSGTVDLRDCKYLSFSSAKKYERHRLIKGDLIVATVGSHPTQPGSVVGRTSAVPESASGSLLNQNAVRLRAKAGLLDQRYLIYLASSQEFRNYIIAHARGAASQVRMSIELLRDMPLLLPTLATQQLVASFLGAYDDLIENNTRRIEILEEMVRRLYEEWFVQYRFPGHEGVELKESELGLIPEGWEVVALEKAVEINPKTKVERDGEKIFVPMGALSETGMVISGWEIKSGNSGAKFQNGDTLVARISPCLENGKTGFVDFLPASQPTACGSTEFIVLRSRSLCPEMVYCLSRSDRFREVAMKSMSGATGRQRVRVESLVGYPIAQPEGELVAKYHAFAQPCFKKIRGLANKNANLRQQRDLLLPKLISGEIDVSDIPMPT